MTPQRAEKLSSDPAVKGNLSADEIVRTDWERTYKGKGVDLPTARKAVMYHARTGQIVRLRNTLFLMPRLTGDEETIEVHTITADPKEVYVFLIYMFLLGIGAKTDIDYVQSYTDDKKAYRAFQPLLGDAMEFGPSDEEGKPKYTMVVNARKLYRNAMFAQQQQQQRGGA